MSMQTILSASLSLNRMPTVQSAHTQIQGKINVMNQEIKRDGGNAKKEEKVKEMEERSGKILDNLMNDLNEVQESMKPSENQAPDSSASAGSNPGTDRVELSQPSISGEEKKAARSEEPVLYDANGNQTRPEPKSSGQKMDARA